MTSLEKFLEAVERIHATGAGVPETSYYGAIEGLFNEIGKQLKPCVFCVLTVSNRAGAGQPDAGFYTDDQRQKRKGHELKEGQKPSRGTLEVKPPKLAIEDVLKSEQVEKYLRAYRLVLVTNLRDWRLVALDENGKRIELEHYKLAGGEKEFWDAARHPKKTAEAHGTQFEEYLKRVLKHRAPVASPEDLAEFLASYARTALDRIESVKDLPALGAVRTALEEALGLKFEDKKGEHFFRSSLIQTLFYGVFSAWVLWARARDRKDGDKFDWVHETRTLRVPVIRKLFYQLADPQQLDELHLTQVMNWAAGVLNRTVRKTFFEKFQEEHAVQYFYEPFLEEFDPELRKQLGVWYTPPEIVKYMVERVDRVLREELNLADGLADKNVYVLDPCCGTGSYLVEVLGRIERTLRGKGGDALVASDLKDAAKERVFGFEILPAPFVVAHLQLGLLLQRLGAPLAERGSERVGVYLTNALTGWEPPKGAKQRLIFPELEEERDAAEKVKREAPILVILGNPPYNAFAGVSPAEEQGLVDSYKTGLVKEWGIKKFNLDDLYVRFFRLAERRVGEKTGRGVVSFVSNHSWVSDKSFVVLRKHLTETFDKFWVENMHGNRKTSEYAPNGRTSETVFAIPGFSAGIQQGVVISLWVKKEAKAGCPEVLFRDDINAARASERRIQLLDSLSDPEFDLKYQSVTPVRGSRFTFRPSDIGRAYQTWPTVPELAEIMPINGLMEKRGGALIDIDLQSLDERMQAYYEPTLEWNELHKSGLTKDAARFDAKKARTKALRAEKFDSARIIRYATRPFENRWCYFTPIRPIWNEPRPGLWKQYSASSRFLMTRPAGVASPEGVPFFFTRCLGDNDFLRGHAYYIPQSILLDESGQPLLVGLDSVHLQKAKLNISSRGVKYLEWIDVRSNHVGLWRHVLAVGYSPEYLSENSDGIREDWPRIPLPNTKELLEASAALGERVAALLDTEAPVAGVTEGEIREELRWMGRITKAIQDSKFKIQDEDTARAIQDAKFKMQDEDQAGAQLKEEDLAITAGWGHAGKGGVTTPGKGRAVKRDYTAAERESIERGAKALGLTSEQAFAHLGAKTYNIYLNAGAYWSNVPERVWEYTIGGYQVIKKWLSYREEKLLGRALKKEEARYVQEMVRRIAAILLLEPALDENYQRVKENAFDWQSLKPENEKA